MDLRAALHTERLVLRPLIHGDIPALVAALDDYDVSKWLTVVPYPYGVEDARWFLDHSAGFGPYEGFGITRDGGPVMGVVGINDSLGYWLGRAHHGRGYMTEAARALVGHWFATSGQDVLTSGHFTGNAASASVLVKLGFRPSHDERVVSRAQGAEVTLHRMRLTREDWARADREAGNGC